MLNDFGKPVAVLVAPPLSKNTIMLSAVYFAYNFVLLVIVTSTSLTPAFSLKALSLYQVTLCVPTFGNSIESFVVTMLDTLLPPLLSKFTTYPAFPTFVNIFALVIKFVKAVTVFTSVPLSFVKFLLCIASATTFNVTFK